MFLSPPRDRVYGGSIPSRANVFSYHAMVGGDVSPGLKVLNVRISDQQARNATASISLTVTPAAQTDPAVTASVTASPALLGGTVLITAAVVPGNNPASTGMTVKAVLAAIGGASDQQLFDDGSNGDTVASNNTFSFRTIIAARVTPGTKALRVVVTEAQSRTVTALVSLEVKARPRRRP